MPIHDLGYRTWQGRRVAEMWRWWAIAETGLRLAWRGRWLRRLLFFAWLPAFYMGVAFFLYEQAAAESNANVRGMAAEFLSQFPRWGTLTTGLSQQDPAAARHMTWAWLLLTFFRYPQGFLMLLVVGLIAPPLIARDVGSRAFLLYFSRPIIRAEYIFGKLAVIWGYVFMITTAPALALYVIGVLLSPNLAVVAYTWDLPLRILAASAVLMIPTAAMALAFSSLTTKTWQAGFAWFAVWVFGLVAYLTLYANLGQALDGRWSLLSLYHTLGEVQSFIFGLPFGSQNQTGYSGVAPAAGMLIAVTVVSLVILFRRVSSPMRI